jgi:prepilin-type N-terminal cleavage/methylation domain-containing protein
MPKSAKVAAFTLVELLVAMAIISVLIGLAIGAVSVAQRSSRDTQRRGALQELATTISEFQSLNQGNLPQNNCNRATAVPPADCVRTTAAADADIIIGTRTVSLKGPAKANTNATSSTNTRYCYYTTTNGYVLGAELESGSWGTTPTSGDWSLSTDRTAAASPVGCGAAGAYGNIID